MKRFPFVPAFALAVILNAAPPAPAGQLSGNKLLLTSIRTGDMEVFVVDPDTGDAFNISRRPQSEDRYPCWSPDGKRIAFTSDRNQSTIRPFRVHGSVNRIIGMENIVDIADPTGRLQSGEQAVFTFEDLTSPAVVVERFFLLGGWKGPRSMRMFANKSGKAVVIRNLGHAGLHKKPSTSGEWFVEDVPAIGLSIGPGEKCWARQFNPESPEADMTEVDGGQLWILGLKTEGRATHIIARNGAKVELLGGVSYQSWDKQPLDPPMFKVINSDASFTFGFYHWNLPFTTIMEETAGTETKTLLRKELTDYHLPLYRASAPGPAKNRA